MDRRDPVAAVWALLRVLVNGGAAGGTLQQIVRRIVVVILLVDPILFELVFVVGVHGFGSVSPRILVFMGARLLVVQ